MSKRPHHYGYRTTKEFCDACFITQPLTAGAQLRLLQAMAGAFLDMDEGSSDFDWRQLGETNLRIALVYRFFAWMAGGEGYQGDPWKSLLRALREAPGESHR